MVRNNAGVSATTSRRNGAVLIDFENLRIAWKHHFRSVITYFDLCAIIAEMQARLLFDCVFIGIYATTLHDTKGNLEREKRAVTIAKVRAMQNPTTANPNQLRKLQRMEYYLTAELKAYEKIITYATADMKKTSAFTLESFEHNAFDQGKFHKSGIRFDRLGGPEKEARHCQVKLEQFGLKQHQGRRVQRGCDAAIVHDIMVLNFSSAIDSVFVLTGDSDFYDTMQKNAANHPDRLWSILAFRASLGWEAKVKLASRRYPPHGPLTSFMQKGEATFFEMETVLPGINPQQVMLGGKRTPIPEDVGAPMNPEDKFYRDWLEHRNAAEQRWHQLEKSPKNSLKTFEAIIEELNECKGIKLPRQSKKNPIAKGERGLKKAMKTTAVANDQERISSSTPHIEINLSDEENSTSDASKPREDSGSLSIEEDLLNEEIIIESDEDLLILSDNEQPPPVSSLIKCDDDDLPQMYLPEGASICLYTNEIIMPSSTPTRPSSKQSVSTPSDSTKPSTKPTTKLKPSLTQVSTSSKQPLPSSGFIDLSSDEA